MKELDCACGMNDCFPGCGCEILSFLGKKWSVYIIMHLMESSHLRFNKFLHLMHKLGPKSLSTRLKEAEELELIGREVETMSPIKVNYYLSEKGKQLGEILEKMKSLVHSWTN